MAAENQSRGSNVVLWLVGLFALGGAALVGLPRGQDSPKPTQTTEPAKDDKTAAPLPPPAGFSTLDVLRNFLRVQAGPTESTSRTQLQYLEQGPGYSHSVTIDNKSMSKSSESLADCLQREPAHYEFLIAAVPDPIESKFPHEFDAVLEGIQRAFEARGFGLQASWLPWPHDRTKQQAETGSQAKQLHRERPGVLLFRKPYSTDNPREQTLAVVCLAGESPISGVHKPAMTQALAARKELSEAIDANVLRWVSGLLLVPQTAFHLACQAMLIDDSKSRICWAGRKEKIQIVAPCYSGSQTSLVRALSTWKAANPDHSSFELITGSASALKPNLFIRADVPVPKTTVIPNDLVTHGVLRYLNGDRGLAPDPRPGKELQEKHRVAFLREANTGFGIAAGSNPDLPGIDLPFPSSISQLAIDPDLNTKSVLPHSEFVEPKTPFRDLTRLDAVPPYDPTTSASRAGHSLREILTTINRARVRYVGIVATDTRDVVFLNRLLRKECPEVRVFTTEPSFVLLHPEEAIHLRGMVVGSTYPLSPVTQYWGTSTISPRRMISFSTQASQGYYNAIMAQFGRTDLMLGYHPPLVPELEKADNDEYKKALLERPPIWISVVGQNGRLVPVHCYPHHGDTHEEKGSRPTLVVAAPTAEVQALYGEKKAEAVRSPRERPAFGIPIGVLIESTVAWIAITLVVLALTVPWFWQNGAGGLTQDEIAVDDLKQPVWVWIWRGVMLAGLLLIALPHTLPVWELFTLNPCSRAQAGWAGWRHWFVVGAAFAILLEIFLVVVLLFLRGCSPPGWLREYPRESRRGYRALGVFALAATAFTWIWWMFWETPLDRFFLYVRATDLAAGLSPFVPMALLGASCFALGWFSLRQMSLSRRIRLPCPYDANVWKDLADADRELRDNLTDPLQFLGDCSFWRESNGSSQRPRHLPVTLGLALLYLGCLVWNVVIISLPSGEGAWWDWTMWLLFWIVAGAVVLTLARFLALWSRLKWLLEAILRVPMVSAFERLPVIIGKLFGGYLYAERPRNQRLAAVAWTLPAEYRRQLAERIRLERPRLVWVFGPDGAVPVQQKSTVPEDQLSREDRRWLAKRLQEYAVAFLGYLPSRWRAQTANAAFGRDAAEQAHPTATDAEASPSPMVSEMEVFVAAYVATSLGAYFAQLRQLVWVLAAAAPLLLFTASSYPFQPDRPRLNSLAGLLGAIAVGTGLVLFQINRDGLVSRITRTTPNRFTPDLGFFSSVSTYVLPILTLLLLQVLGLVRFIVEPILTLFQ